MLRLTRDFGCLRRSAALEKLPARTTSLKILNRLKSMWFIIAFIGTQELKNETVSLKNLDNQTQTEMTVEDACKIILGTTLISQVQALLQLQESLLSAKHLLIQLTQLKLLYIP